MSTPSYSAKKRLLIIFVVVVLLSSALIIRLGFLQIVRGEQLKKGALEQWTKGIDIKSRRGVIYDRKGKKLAVSISASTVWASPADIKSDVAKDTAKEVARVLGLDEEVVYKKITKKVGTEKIKQWITKEEAIELRKLKLRGIEIVDDNKRYYPYGNFASFVLGFTDIDNNGLYGIERTYDKYLTGTPGKWVKTTDAASRQLPFDGEKIYEASDGLSVVLTIDETIQHFAEKAAGEAIIVTKAKNISVIVMEPNSGDILAMVSKPDYDPNKPREPLDNATKKEWEGLPIEELQNRWYNTWRNFAINDSYEPGSTFKIITATAAIEENAVQPETHFFCDGFIKGIKGVVLKCSRWYNPHGSQTFIEGMNNSCNVVFVDVGRKLGKERLYKYIKAFGFGENTGIDLNGEQGGIIPANTDVIKEVNLATISYGHGIAVTPMQLINAISAIANGGNLMKPRLVKELIDGNGKVVTSYEPEIRRKVVSEATSEKMMKMLESVVENGTGSSSYIPGFRVGGKTGTARKVIDGRYAPGKYISSLIAVAPADNPQIAILVVVDEPVGPYYGGTVAGPTARSVIEDTLNYLEVAPVFTEKEKEHVAEKVIVPDIRNMKIGEAGKALANIGLKYTTEYLDLTSESIVLDQFPLPKVEVQKGSIIDLYLDVKGTNTIMMPSLIGKTKEETIKILDGLNLNYNLKGNGMAEIQNPSFGEEINNDTKIEVEFKER